MAITLVVAVTASAEPIRETEDDGDIIGFSSDPEEGNTVYRNEDLVEAHRDELYKNRSSRKIYSARAQDGPQDMERN